jgi:hypothetical protein
MTKDAAQPDRVEGFLSAPIWQPPYDLCLIMELSYDGRVSLGDNPNPPCQHSLWEETGVPGEPTTFG